MTTATKNIAVTQDGAFCLAANSYSITRVLAASTAETFAVPTNSAGEKASHVFFSADGDFWTAWTANGDDGVAESDVTAAIPAADVTDGSSPELNPTQRHLSRIAKISLIASSARLVNMIFFWS